MARSAVIVSMRYNYNFSIFLHSRRAPLAEAEAETEALAGYPSLPVFRGRYYLFIVTLYCSAVAGGAIAGCRTSCSTQDTLECNCALAARHLVCLATWSGRSRRGWGCCTDKLEYVASSLVRVALMCSASCQLRDACLMLRCALHVLRVLLP